MLHQRLSSFQLEVFNELPMKNNVVWIISLPSNWVHVSSKGKNVRTCREIGILYIRRINEANRGSYTAKKIAILSLSLSLSHTHNTQHALLHIYRLFFQQESLRKCILPLALSHSQPLSLSLSLSLSIFFNFNWSYFFLISFHMRSKNLNQTILQQQS